MTIRQSPSSYPPHSPEPRGVPRQPGRSPTVQDGRQWSRHNGPAATTAGHGDPTCASRQPTDSFASPSTSPSAGYGAGAALVWSRGRAGLLGLGLARWGRSWSRLTSARTLITVGITFSFVHLYLRPVPASARVLGGLAPCGNASRPREARDPGGLAPCGNASDWERSGRSETAREACGNASNWERRGLAVRRPERGLGLN